MINKLLTNYLQALRPESLNALIRSGQRASLNSQTIIAERIDSEVRAQITAQKNKLSGLSKAEGILKQADAAADSLMTIVDQLKELAELAKDENLQGVERQLLEQQAKELIKEFDAIASKTRFGSQFLLTGGHEILNLGGNFEISFRKISSSTSGGLTIVRGEANSIRTPQGEGDIYSINGKRIPISGPDGVSTFNPDTSALAVAEAINSVSNKTGVTAKVIKPEVSLEVSPSAPRGEIDLGSQDFVINGISIEGVISNVSELIDAINLKSDETGIIANYKRGTEVVVFQSSDGRNIEIKISNSSGSGFFQYFDTRNNLDLFGAGDDTGIGGGGFHLSEGGALRYSGAIELVSSSQIRVEGSLSHLQIGISANTYGKVANTSTRDIDLSTPESAERALEILDATAEDIMRFDRKIETLHSRLDIRSAYLLSSTNNLGEYRERWAEAQEALKISDVTSKSILMAQRESSLYHSSLNAFRVRSLLENLGMLRKD